ncbi:MAG TPA: hypothetical protein PKY91_12800, partial [Rhodocyclaceae bacterium]|nr:hypothetical protein [Rhodocyclaceae bacterium]
MSFAVREAEMRCHRATNAAEANVKDGVVVRHMETSDGIAANLPLASVEREQESDISTDDIEALMKRLGDDPAI